MILLGRQDQIGRFGRQVDQGKRSVDLCIKRLFIMKNYFQLVFHFRFINKSLFRNSQKNINRTGEVKIVIFDQK